VEEVRSCIHLFFSLVELTVLQTVFEQRQDRSRSSHPRLIRCSLHQ
jgi:hypothetical protein